MIKPCNQTAPLFCNVIVGGAMILVELSWPDFFQGFWELGLHGINKFKNAEQAA